MLIHCNLCLGMLVYCKHWFHGEHLLSVIFSGARLTYMLMHCNLCADRRGLNDFSFLTFMRA